jgi:hypothetical protein
LRDTLKEARLRGFVSSVLAEARQGTARRLEGLLASPGEPGYNANAEKPPEKWDKDTRAWVKVAAMCPEAKHVLERVLHRWPSVQKMLSPARKRARNVTKSHEATVPAPTAKLS